MVLNYFHIRIQMHGGVRASRYVCILNLAGAGPGPGPGPGGEFVHCACCIAAGWRRFRFLKFWV